MPSSHGTSYTNWETPELSAVLFSIWPAFSIYTLMAIFENVLFFRVHRILNWTIFLNMHQILLKVSWGKVAFWNVPLRLDFPGFYLYKNRTCLLVLKLSPGSGNSEGLCPSKNNSRKSMLMAVFLASEKDFLWYANNGIFDSLLWQETKLIKVTGSGLWKHFIVVVVLFYSSNA